MPIWDYGDYGRVEKRRVPLSSLVVEEMLAARGIDVSHETVRQWFYGFTGTPYHFSI